MDPELYQRACDLFLRACATPPAERGAFVTRTCGDDGALREVVLELLANDRSLIPDRIPILAAPDLTQLQPGDRVGNYVIERLLGEGGMGLVYLAEQTEPVRRKVAIKILRAGFDTRSLLLRFARERHLLALMDHPAIAKVFDAGATETGRPYFVMEYVAGVPITRYCDDNRLGIRARLALFVQVCGAIQHAHQKSIIHRDIKPSNVLVVELDGVPTARVIDFGIAKALEDTESGATQFSRHGSVLGTPEYMSPEQAAGGEATDTRTDVYSLGVLLYELLSGCRPMEPGQFQSAASLHEAMRGKPLKRPSTRIRDMGDDARAIAHGRSIDPGRLERALRSDLDWIAMRALEFERARRYPSASELAADVERYLAGEAVVARPPTAHYRLRKYIRRHRVLVSASAAVAVTLLAGLVTTTWQARQARARLERIHHVSRILVSRFYDLADQVGGMETKESLAQLAVVTLEDLSRRSHLSAQEQRDLANAYEALSQVQGDSYSSSLGRFVEARQSIRQALPLREAVFASDTTSAIYAAELMKCQYLMASYYQGDNAVDGPALLESALARARQVLERSKTADVMVLASICNVLLAEEEYANGNVHSARGRLQDALALREALVRFEPANDEYKRLLADIYKTISYETDDAAESLRLASRALALNEAYARAHPFRWRGLMDLSYAHRNLGYALRRTGDLSGALAEMRDCLSVRARMAAADTLDVRARHFVADGYHLVGSIHFERGAVDSALAYHRRGQDVHERLLRLPSPPNWMDYEIGYTYEFLADSYASLGDTTQARWFYTRSLARAPWLAPDTSSRLMLMRRAEEYVHFLFAIGDSSEARYRHLWCNNAGFVLACDLAANDASPTAFADAVAGACHYATFTGLADTLRSNMMSELAVQYAVRWLGPAHPLTVRAMAVRGDYLATTGSVDAARRSYLDALSMQPDFVLAFRGTNAVIGGNLELVSAAGGACRASPWTRARSRNWTTRESRLIKRNRLWGQEEWPVIIPLQPPALVTAGGH